MIPFALPGRSTLLALAALALAAGGMAFQYQRAERFKQEVTATRIEATATIGRLVHEYRDQSGQLELCQKASRKFADLYRDTQSEVARAKRGLADATGELSRLSARLAAQEDTDRDISECQSVLDTDLRACPATVAGLRQRAAGAVPRQGERHRSTRVHKAGPDTDG